MEYTSGQRITVRDEDFFISSVVQSDNSFILTTEGITELVKGKQFVFDTSIDKDITPVDPVNTIFEKDSFAGYLKTKLYIETRKRKSTTNSEQITIAHKAAFNVADFQLTPALKALKMPRPRILIADAVGLGKTIEVGILLAELMKRGKAKRIMVLALKSILGQFQQEMWNRFSIPLVRLDSYGIAQLKSELPSNKNPFDYYEKTIVSIDTLKHNAKFRHYIEKSNWDVIVIDECHTVSNFGSQRGNLAAFLSNKCESLILASATPHNGNPQSFANLISMLDPVAIPKNGKYDKDQVEPYYVRRFKGNIDDESVKSKFKDRKLHYLSSYLTQEELDFLEYREELKIDSLKSLKADKSNKDLLFSIMIFKAFMSSPSAALKSIRNRLQKVQNLNVSGSDYESNIEILEKCEELIQKVIANDADSKYLVLKKMLTDLKWKGRDKDDRFVIFAERISTLAYLEGRLKEDFKLKDKSISTFSGTMSDNEQREMIEDFGTQDSSVRVLLCSDAGAQGVNLHYYCHRMVNYDIPWSLITLDQRNGRIDRYGQEKQPEIYYIIGKSENEAIKTDLHIIENIARKEDEVRASLGDVSSALGSFNAKKEEELIEEKMIKGDDSDLEDEIDLSVWGGSESTELTITDEPVQENYSLYKEDKYYYNDLFSYLNGKGILNSNEYTFDDNYLELMFTKEIKSILYNMPPEAMPKSLNDFIKLTIDKDLVQKSIDNARKKSGEWAEFQMLYDLHPAIALFMTKLEASVPKNHAPAAKLSHLPKNSFWYVLQGQVSNNRGQSVLNEIFVVSLEKGKISAVKLRDFIDDFSLKEKLNNQEMSDHDLQILKHDLPRVIEYAKVDHLKPIVDRLTNDKLGDLVTQEKKISDWKIASSKQLELSFNDNEMTHISANRKKKIVAEINSIVDSQSNYMKDVFALDNEPYIQVLGAFYNN